jgi:hypothetical protein
MLLSSQLGRERRSGGLPFQASPGKKFMRPHINRKSWTQWHTPVTPATVENVNRRIQASLDKKQDYLKN